MCRNEGRRHIRPHLRDATWAMLLTVVMTAAVVAGAIVSVEHEIDLRRASTIGSFVFGVFIAVVGLTSPPQGPARKARPPETRDRGIADPASTRHEDPPRSRGGSWRLVLVTFGVVLVVYAQHGAAAIS